VLEFFTDKAVEPNEPLLRLMSQIGTQLGRCVERDRAESRLKKREEALAGAKEAAEAARDAAERARADAETARADVDRTREVLQTVLDNMSDGIALLDRDLHLRFINRKLMEFQQYTPEVACPGASMDDLLRFQAERGDFGRLDDVERIVQ